MVNLQSLTIESLRIPFKYNFQHASADRSTTESVIVKATTHTGVQGLGEGCPRNYVTGESIGSAMKFFHRCHDELLCIQSVEDLVEWMNLNESDVDLNPSAFCAIELALLDALSKSTNSSMDALLGLPEVSGVFQYSGILGEKNPDVFRSLLNSYLDLEMKDFKVKLFGNVDVDANNLNNIARRDLMDLRLRFDANNYWLDPEDAVQYIKNLSFPFFALEEPLEVGNYNGMRYAGIELGSRIILDESFLCLSDFIQIRNVPDAWIVNVRISKMGGLIRSLNIARRARELGIPVIVGAQVGETSILSRAAISLANVNRDNLIAQEGAFGTFLLEYDLLDPPLMFGNGGVLRFNNPVCP